MAQLIMDHGVSGCFGTKWAPPTSLLTLFELNPLLAARNS